jgi:anti-sigma28 factor (negative regulator of flagellin synthesis)
MMKSVERENSMKSFYRGKPISYSSRSEKVSAIRKEVNNGTYVIDSTNLANTMIIHLLNHSLQFQESPLKRQLN